MINVLFYFIVIIGFWSIITIISKGPKSYETSIIISDIFISSKELIITIFRLVKLLIQEKKSHKATEEFNQEEKISTINESNYAEITNELYTQFRKGK